MEARRHAVEGEPAVPVGTRLEHAAAGLEPDARAGHRRRDVGPAGERLAEAQNRAGHTSPWRWQFRCWIAGAQRAASRAQVGAKCALAPGAIHEESLSDRKVEGATGAGFIADHDNRIDRAFPDTTDLDTSDVYGSFPSHLHHLTQEDRFSGGVAAAWRQASARARPDVFSGVESEQQGDPADGSHFVVRIRTHTNGRSYAHSFAVDCKNQRKTIAHRDTADRFGSE
jgi:hypothetical protein